MEYESADPYDHLAWRSDLIRTAQDYLDADDALRRANEELKPYRKKKKEGKGRVEELMERHRLDRLAFDERRETLILVHRRTKRKPTAEQMLERCQSFCQGDAARGQRLFDFVFQPVEQEIVSLRRKKGVEEDPPVQEEDE